MPHRPTAPEATKPPTNAIETVGASRMFSSSTRSSPSTLRVREKTAIAPSEISVYSQATRPAADAEREIDGAPDQRDRQDQEADQDEQGLAQPDLVAVAGVGADPCDAIDPCLGEPGERVHWPRSVTAPGGIVDAG